MAEGRLTVAELQERLDTVYGAKTLSELEPVTWDLPGHRTWCQRRRRRRTSLIQDAAAARILGGGEDRRHADSTVAGGILSGATGAGPGWCQHSSPRWRSWAGWTWTSPRRGSPRAEVTITAVAIMGGVDITVPDDITVIVNGIGIHGRVRGHRDVKGPPGARSFGSTGSR